MSRGLSQQGTIDPQRLRRVVGDDLLQEKLLDWLEANSTLTEKVAAEKVAAEEAGAETA